MKLSHSQYNTFDWCKKKWYLSYRVKVRIEPRPHPLTFGIAFHEGTEVFAKGQGAEDALSRFHWSYSLDQKGEEPEVWVPRGNTMLEALFDRIDQFNEFDVVEAEQFRTRQLDHIKFTGKIDCIAKVDGKLTIIDWKTASDVSKYNDNKIDTDYQLTSYAWLAEDVGWDELAFMVVGKSDKPEVKWCPTTRSPQAIAGWKRVMLRVADEMERYANTLPPGQHDYHCDWCDFANTQYCTGKGDF